jgi:catechol 2,3-dioxygenase-like lactoylglutathione lyase family enzyme
VNSTTNVCGPAKFRLRRLRRHLLMGIIVMTGSTFSAQSPLPAGAQADTTVTVRYIVKDVPASVEFYTKYLGFTVALDARPGFASLARGPLRLALSGMTGQGGGARAMPDGRKPEPGGWNRIQISIGDLVAPACRRSSFPQRHREGKRRRADPARGPIRESDRAVPGLLRDETPEAGNH